MVIQEKGKWYHSAIAPLKYHPKTEAYFELYRNIRNIRQLSTGILFSRRRFMKRNATNIVTLFFNPHELTKIGLKSSTKFYGPKMNHLASRTEPKRFFLFFRVTSHRERLKSPPFRFFGIVRLAFGIFSSKGPPPSFLMFCDRMDVKKCQRVPLLARQFRRLGFSWVWYFEFFWHFHVLLLFLSLR